MTVELIKDEPEGLVAAVDKSANIFLSMLGDVGASSTAKLIADTLDKTDKIIGVLLFDAAHDSMYQPPSILEGTTKRFTGGVVLVNVKSPLWLKGKKLPLGISLIHEMGHAKQFIEKGIWFESKFAEAMKIGLDQGRAKNPAKYEIEDFNVSEHEEPTCRELGLPSRHAYD